MVSQFCQRGDVACRIPGLHQYQQRYLRIFSCLLLRYDMVSAVLFVRCSLAERPIAFHDRCAFANERVKIGPRIKSTFRRWKINCLELTAVPTARPEIFQIHPGYAANFGDSP